LPDLLRRVFVLTIASAVGIALLMPLTARSAVPGTAEATSLLEAAAAADATLDRSALDGRERSAALTLFELARSITAEDLNPVAALPTPGSAPMEATLYLNATPPPAPVIVAPPTSGDTISGSATWYCCSLGYRGEAVVALPGALGGHYDSPPASRYVTVCGDRCARLPVVDYCGCSWGTASQKVADLSPEAWAAVSDSSLSMGVIHVTIHLGG
jgi:hypothetical protein